MPAPDPPGNYESPPGTALEELSKVITPSAIPSGPGEQMRPSTGRLPTDAPMPQEDNGTAASARSPLRDTAAPIVGEDPDDSGTATQDRAKASVSKAGAQIRQNVGKAAGTIKGHAEATVDSARRKVRDVSSQVDSAMTRTTEYINADPVRAVKIAAIGSAVISAALALLTRRRP